MAVKTVKNDSQEEEQGTNLVDWKRRALQVTLTGWDAYKCCIGGKLSAQKFLLDTSNLISELFHGRLTEGRVPLPAVDLRPLLRLVLPLGRHTKLIAWYGIRPDGTEFSMGESFLPDNVAELERMTAPLAKCAEQTRRSEKDCLRCIEARMMSQRNQRKKIRKTVNRRVRGFRGIR